MFFQILAQSRLFIREYLCEYRSLQQAEINAINTAHAWLPKDFFLRLSHLLAPLETARLQHLS